VAVDTSAFDSVARRRAPLRCSTVGLTVEWSSTKRRTTGSPDQSVRGSYMVNNRCLLIEGCLLWVGMWCWTAGCAQPTWRAQSGSPTMPDPGGCYVLVYEGAQFSGAREYINGPARQRRLTELPFGSNWRNRIRSARVGPRATVTMWTDEGLAGTSQRLTSNSEHSRLETMVSGRIESLEITCSRAL
jgi:hypothetical protein